MDVQSNFEHLCRVCAANTKGKNTVAECVYIFKTAELKDKIERFLYLKIADDDHLPKVLCKTCYRQVEATASLSKIAQHTQQVFRDFLYSSLPKHCQTKVYDEASCSQHDEFRPITLPKAPETTISLAPPQPKTQLPVTASASATVTARPPVVPSKSSLPPPPPQAKKKLVAIAPAPPPLKLIHPTLLGVPALAKMNDVAIGYGNRSENRPRTKNTTIGQRRNSCIDARSIPYTPASIAQRSLLNTSLSASIESLRKSNNIAATTVSSVPIPVPVPLAAAAVAVAVPVQLPAATAEKEKPATVPGGVINFIQTHGKITGSVNGTDNVSDKAKKVYLQKRSNLKSTLSNINSISSGQVSLLKSSQNRSNVEQQQSVPPITTTKINKALLNEPYCEESLPEHIIIAAPKQKRKEGTIQAVDQSKLLKPQPKPHIDVSFMMQSKKQNQSSLKETTSTKTKHLQESQFSKKKAKNQLDNCESSSSTSQAAKETICSNIDAPPVNSLTEGILLGSVIRDPDLLKLILKALKWPVTSINFDEQMNLLKVSKFVDIMSDSNLLQDTDLTQLLGPYIRPVLVAAKMLREQHQSTDQCSTENAGTRKTSPGLDINNTGDFASAISYKLPPETSVQLVPSTPGEQNNDTSISPSAQTIEYKEGQRKERGLEEPSLVITENCTPVASTSQSNLNARLATSSYKTNLSTHESPNALSLLKKYQNSKTKEQKSKLRERSGSSPSSSLNLEDIVLVEPQPPLPPLEAEPLFKLPSWEPAATPIVTRPIIKRRKTVIQAPKSHTVEHAAETTTVAATEKPVNSRKVEIVQNKEIKLSKKEINENIETPEVPTSSTKASVIKLASAAAAAVATTATNAVEESNKTRIKRCPGNAKSLLGQQLLQAIGLQKINAGNSSGEATKPRDTLRSVLKRSLKQAQEQQQLKRTKIEEPSKQEPNDDSIDEDNKVNTEAAKRVTKQTQSKKMALSSNKKEGNESIDNTENMKTLIKSIKSEKPETAAVSTVNTNLQAPKKRGRKPKDRNQVENHVSAAEQKVSERWDADDDLPLKQEPDLEKTNTRPTRASKALSKYYKDPSRSLLKCNNVSKRASRHRT